MMSGYIQGTSRQVTAMPHMPLMPSTSGSRETLEVSTAHSLRHTMRDRLRAVECPMDMIDQIGGWRSVGGVGVSYGEGYGLDKMIAYLNKVL